MGSALCNEKSSELGAMATRLEHALTTPTKFHVSPMVAGVMTIDLICMVSQTDCLCAPFVVED